MSSTIPFLLVKTKSRVFGLFPNRPLMGECDMLEEEIISYTFLKMLRLDTTFNIVSRLLVFSASVYQFCQSMLG